MLSLTMHPNWEILRQHTVDDMCVVRWLNLHGSTIYTAPDKVVEHESKLDHEKCSESFPIEVGSLLAETRYWLSNLTSMGVIYGTKSIVRRVYEADCYSYLNSEGVLVARKDRYFAEGWENLRSVWNRLDRSLITYTEVFISSPTPVAIVYYGEEITTQDREVLQMLSDKMELPIYHCEPTLEN